MKFGKRLECDTTRDMGEYFPEFIEVIGGKRQAEIGNIFFTRSGKPRYVDSESSHDYTVVELKEIIAKMEEEFTKTIKENYETRN